MPSRGRDDAPDATRSRPASRQARSSSLRPPPAGAGRTKTEASAQRHRLASDASAGGVRARPGKPTRPPTPSAGTPAARAPPQQASSLPFRESGRGGPGRGRRWEPQWSRLGLPPGPRVRSADACTSGSASQVAHPPTSAELAWLAGALAWARVRASRPQGREATCWGCEAGGTRLPSVEGAICAGGLAWPSPHLRQPGLPVHGAKRGPLPGSSPLPPQAGAGRMCAG